MFSSQSLIHLVFADPMDDYYSGLLKLDLDHYLWLKLHERFSSVYFLRKSERGFSVSTFGDKGATPFESNPGKLSKLKDAFSGKSSIQRFGDWMLEQLCNLRSEAAAFVCPAEDFVSVTKGAEWEQILRGIRGAKNRTGILVLTLPLQAERCRELLLGQNLFKHLGDAALSDLRGGSPRVLFQALKKEKKDACTILAPYAGSCLHSILLRLQLEDPRFLLSEADEERVVRYLHRYLQDLRLQQEAPLLGENEPAIYLSSRDLYLRLKEPRVWEGLLSRSRQAAAGEETSFLADALVPPDREGLVGRCLIKAFAESGSSGCEAVRESQNSEQILRRLLWLRNEKEHPQVVVALSDFLQRLSHADLKDKDSRGKILEAMRFCSDWLCVPDGSEAEADVLALIERQKIDLDLSRLAFESAENQRALEAVGAPYETKLKQAKDLARAHRLNAEQYHELIKSSVMDLSLSRFSGKEVFEKLSALESRFQAQADEAAELSGKPETDEQASGESASPQPETDLPFDMDKLTPEQKKKYEEMLYNL